MSRLPYRGLGYDPRQFKDTGGKSFDAFQRKTILHQVVERPTVILTSVPVVDAWNIVKSDDADSIFDVTASTKGPIESDFDSGAEDWLFIHFNQPTPSDASDFVLLFILGTAAGDVYEMELSSNGTPQGTIIYRRVTAPFNPATLTWNTRPTTVPVNTDNQVHTFMAGLEFDRLQKDVASGGLTVQRIIRFENFSSIHGVAINAGFSGSSPGAIFRLLEVVSLAVDA